MEIKTKVATPRAKLATSWMPSTVHNHQAKLSEALHQLSHFYM